MSEGSATAEAAPRIPVPSASAVDGLDSVEQAGAHLLRLDVRHRRLQVRNEQVSLLLKQLTCAIGVAVALVGIIVIVSAYRANSVVVQAFDAPPALGDQGINGTVLASSLQDSLSTIQNSVRTTAQRRSIDNAWTGEIDVQVPQTGVSISDLSKILRRELGSETYISGSLVLNDDDSISLMVRGTGIPPKTFTGERAELPDLTLAAAEYVFGMFEPRLFAVYLFQNGRGEEGEQFVADAFARADDEIRPELLTYWGLMLSSQRKRPEAIDKLRLAVEQDPTQWRAWNSLLGNVRIVHGDEAGWRIGQEIVAAAAAAPDDDKPDALGWYNYQNLAQDWTGQIEQLEEDARRTGGGGSFGVLSATLLAEAEAHRHDWEAVERRLGMADPNDASLPPMRLYLRGMRALEAVDNEGAAAIFDEFYALWRETPPLQYQFDRAPCYIGLAYALVGRNAESLRAFAEVRANSVCETFKALIVERAGDARATDRAFRRAVAIAPSVPFAYQHWGESLVRRGDLARARSMFAKASRQAPRWADPLKADADILAVRGDWAGALDRYDAAIRFAPGWPELRQARALAARRVEHESRDGLIGTLIGWLT